MWNKNRASTTILAVCSLISLSLLTGCETDEDNKLAGAQECLDKLRDSDSDAVALACENKVAGIESPQAYVIRCSVRFFVGGIKTSTMIDAYNAYDAASESQKASILMNSIAQTDITAATNTLNACKKTHSPSLNYIATLSFTGTSIKLGGVGGDAGDIASNLAKCENVDGGGNPQGGVCDDAAIGTAVVSMYDLYCIGDAATSTVCTEVNSAIVNAGGSSNPEAIALALYNLLAN